MNRKSSTSKLPRFVRLLEVLGLPEDYIGGDGLKGHIPKDHTFLGYRIGSKIKRKVMIDCKLFVHQCYPDEIYIKRKANEVLHGLPFRKIYILTDFKNPYVIDVLSGVVGRDDKNYAKAAD